VGRTRVTFRWDAPTRRWQQTIAGSVARDADGKPVSTADVLVQFCQVTTDYGDIDQAGSPAAYTHTLGSGRAVLFRDGRRIEGTWQRSQPDQPTRFRAASGGDLLLRPGNVWVVLAATGSPLTSG
jgi:hypothetical protein